MEGKRGPGEGPGQGNIYWEAGNKAAYWEAVDQESTSFLWPTVCTGTEQVC